MPLPEGNALVYACVLYVSALKAADIELACTALQLASDEYDKMGHAKVSILRIALKESIIATE